MTTLTQLIQESAKTVSPETKYSLRPGEANALVLTLCVNRNIPDFDEAMDMLHRFDDLSPAEQVALAKRIAEIAKESDKSVGFKHMGGPLVNIWIRDNKTREIQMDVIANEFTGRMVCNMGNVIIITEAEPSPKPKPYFKGGDL